MVSIRTGLARTAPMLLGEDLPDTDALQGDADVEPTADVPDADLAPVGDEDDGDATRPDLRRQARTTSGQQPSSQQPSSQQPSQESKTQGRRQARTGDENRRAALESKLPPKKQPKKNDDVVKVDTVEYRAPKTVGDVYQSTMDALTVDDAVKMARAIKGGQVPVLPPRAQAAYEAFRAQKRWPDSDFARTAFANLAVARVGYSSSMPIGGEDGERRFAKESLFKALPAGEQTLSPLMRPFIDAVIDPRTKLTDAETKRLESIYVDNGDGTRTTLNALRNRARWDANAMKDVKPGTPGFGFRTTIDAGFAWQQADPARYAFSTAASRAGYSAQEIELAAQEGARRGAPLWGTGAGFNSAFSSKEDYEQRGKFEMVAGRMMGEYCLPDYAVRDLEDARRALRTGYPSVDAYRTNLGKSAPGTWLTEQITAANTAVGGFLERNGLDDPIARGVREAVNEYAQVGGNLVNMGAMLAYKPYAGIVKGDFRLQSEDEDAYWNAAPRRLENAVAAANTAIPGDSGTIASVFRGLTTGVAKLPVYAAGTIAPPLLVFWNAGKYANRPIEEFAGGIAMDAVTVMTAGVGGGPFASSLIKRLEQAGLKEAQALLANRTGAAVVSAATNTALPASQAAAQLYGPGNEKLTPEQRKELEKQLSLQTLTMNAMIGFSTAMLAPAHRDVDVQLQKNGTVLGDIFTAERPNGRVYAGNVKTKTGSVEFVELDPRDPRIQGKVKSAKPVGQGDVDLALVASRAQNRVKPGDLPALVDQSAKFGLQKLKADLEIASAATTKSADAFTPTLTVQTQAARMNGLAKIIPSSVDELAALGARDLEQVFGAGPHTVALAQMAHFEGFAEFARKNPVDAKYLYEMNQAIDVPGVIAKSVADGGPGAASFSRAAQRLREHGVTVAREGEFVVVLRPPGKTFGQPALEVTLGTNKDLAFTTASPVSKNGKLELVPSDLVQPMRISLDKIATSS
jgi:hypothetical protein